MIERDNTGGIAMSYVNRHAAPHVPTLKGTHTHKEKLVQANKNVRRLAGSVAVMAAAAGGMVALATPAGAATGPSATLRRGTVTVTGTAARDVILVTVDANQLTVDFGFDGTVDSQFKRSRFLRVAVLAGEGDDGVSVQGTGVGDLPITISGGGGNDFVGVVGNIGDFGTDDVPVTISGDGGNDFLDAAVPGPVTMQAGAGDDLVVGGGAGTGEEIISLGDGNDRFQSGLSGFPGGTRSDIVDGGTGQDALEVGGSFESESVTFSANAGHLIVDLNLRNRIDSDNIEAVSWVGFGGLDESGTGDGVSVSELSGADVVSFTADFTDPLDGTGPNNSFDQLRVVGTAGVDDITVTGSGANISVAGLTPTVAAVNLASDDTLRIDTLEGRDTVDSSGLQRGLVQLQVF